MQSITLCEGQLTLSHPDLAHLPRIQVTMLLSYPENKTIKTTPANVYIPDLFHSWTSDRAAGTLPEKVPFTLLSWWHSCLPYNLPGLMQWLYLSIEGCVLFCQMTCCLYMDKQSNNNFSFFCFSYFCLLLTDHLASYYILYRPAYTDNLVFLNVYKHQEDNLVTQEYYVR